MVHTLRSRSSKGHAVVEIALISPWIFLLFLGIVNFGFYAYAAISTANAARIAAAYTSSGPSALDDSLEACNLAIEEMRPLPNIKTVVNCGACAAGATCVAGPLKVTATAKYPGVDGTAASEVAVEYQTIQMFPLPWLTGQWTIRRTVQMRQRS